MFSFVLSNNKGFLSFSVFTVYSAYCENELTGFYMNGALLVNSFIYPELTTFLQFVTNLVNPLTVNVPLTMTGFYVRGTLTVKGLRISSYTLSQHSINFTDSR